MESTGTKITQEVVWNHGVGKGASGGGVSEKFPVPAYQAAAKVPASVNPSHFAGRGVPDISGNADPATGYQISVDGKSAVFGGTSAVAPLWAALIALINQQRGTHAGFVNPALYAAAAKNGLRDITAGNKRCVYGGERLGRLYGVGEPEWEGAADGVGGREKRDAA